MNSFDDRVKAMMPVTRMAGTAKGGMDDVTSAFQREAPSIARASSSSLGVCLEVAHNQTCYKTDEESGIGQESATMACRPQTGNADDLDSGINRRVCGTR